MNRPFEPNVTRLKKFRRRFPLGIVKGAKLAVYNFGIQAITPGMIFSYHLESMRITIVSFFKRQSKPLIRTVPNVSYTAKPFDIRRGRGKGSVDGWYFYVRTGKILVEFPSPTLEQAQDLAAIIRSKLPIKTKLVTKESLAAAQSKPATHLATNVQ